MSFHITSALQMCA